MRQQNRNMLSKVVLIAMIWMLAFQRPLEDIWHPYFFIDEITAVIGACLGLYDITIVRKGRVSRGQLWIGIPLVVFVAVGLTGNLVYRYQPLKCVIIDLYTNLKFFFAIGTGYYLFDSLNWDEMKKTVQWNARVITLILFVLFLADRIFHFWPGQIRYGIMSSKLFYGHQTYLVGTMAFLMALLTVFYDKKNSYFLGMAVVIMISTLRSKAFASAALFVVMYIFLLVLRLRVRLWHVLVVVAGSISLAWNMVKFYFLDLAGESARSIMLQTSIRIMKEYFPLGTGFGTFGSEQATRYYSPVYLKYNFNDFWEVRDIQNLENSLRLIKQDKWLLKQYQLYSEEVFQWSQYICDQFWPTIFGQVGVLGTVAFLTILSCLLVRCLSVKKFDRYSYVGVLFIICYLMISSVAESVFYNSFAIPLALILGIVFAKQDRSQLVQ